MFNYTNVYDLLAQCLLTCLLLRKLNNLKNSTQWIFIWIGIDDLMHIPRPLSCNMNEKFDSLICSSSYNISVYWKSSTDSPQVCLILSSCHCTPEFHQVNQTSCIAQWYICQWYTGTKDDSLGLILGLALGLPLAISYLVMLLTLIIRKDKAIVVHLIQHQGALPVTYTLSEMWTNSEYNIVLFI